MNERHSPSRCPNCSKLLDSGTAPFEAPGAKPTVGDITIGSGCSIALQFDAGMVLRELTREQLARLAPQDRRQILLLQAATTTARASVNAKAKRTGESK